MLLVWFHALIIITALFTIPNNSQICDVMVVANWYFVLHLRIGKDRFEIQVSM